MTNRPDKFDGRPHIRLDHGLPENKKITGLSNAAFRLYIEAICWCSRQESDGLIPAAQLKKLGTVKAIAELATTVYEHPLLQKVGSSYEIRDYLAHQRSREEIQELRDTRMSSGALGAHTRWHVARRRKDPDCDYCKGVKNA